jgi:hypothetical protein
MRAMYYCYVILLLSFCTGAVHEMNMLHLAEKGYPLIPYMETPSINSTIGSADYNNTLAQYSLDRVPSQTGSNFYLATGGMMLTAYNAFNQIFLYTTLGLSGFLNTAFPSMPVNIRLGIDAMITINNLVAAISFLRGITMRFL